MSSDSESRVRVGYCSWVQVGFGFILSGFVYVLVFRFVSGSGSTRLGFLFSCFQVQVPIPIIVNIKSLVLKCIFLCLLFMFLKYFMVVVENESSR